MPISIGSKWNASIIDFLLLQFFINLFAASICFFLFGLPSECFYFYHNYCYFDIIPTVFVINLCHSTRSNEFNHTVFLSTIWHHCTHLNAKQHNIWSNAIKQVMNTHTHHTHSQIESFCVDQQNLSWPLIYRKLK